eukprot:m.66465 g.66465  ORF g.66465 m.66465 type:complete len:699 (+) comp14056_c0_seq1:3-2099(+)
MMAVLTDWLWPFHPIPSVYWLIYAFSSGLLAGIGLCIVVAILAYQRWLAISTPAEREKTPFGSAKAGQSVEDFLRRHPRPQAHQNDTLPREQLSTINLILLFLFQQLRDTINVKRRFLVILDRNFDYMIHRTPLGRFCKRLTVYDLNFGDTLPEFNWITAVRPKVGELGSSDHLEVELDLAYEGNFNLTIQADLIFGRTAMISVSIVKLQGVGRMGWVAADHPHWYFSFLEEPELVLEVEAIFDGRSFPQLASIVKTQLHSVIRRNHVMPTRKIRYSPFFGMPVERADFQSLFDEIELYAGTLEVKVIKATGLKGVRDDSAVFATLSLEAEANDADHKLGTDAEYNFKVTCLKAGLGGTIGILFETQSRTSQECVLEAIKLGSPASETKLRVGDIVTHINGLPILKTQQAMRLIKEAPFEVELTVLRKGEVEPETEEAQDAARQHTRRTQPKPCQHPIWSELFYFDVTPRHSRLYIRLYDCMLNRKGQPTGKRFLVGYAELDLEHTAFFCALHQAPLSKTYRLRNSPLEGSVDSGTLELILKHTPRPSEHVDEGIQEASDPTDQRRDGIRSPAPSEQGDVSGQDAANSLLAQAQVAEPLPGSETVDSQNELFADLAPLDRRKELQGMLDTVVTQIELENETRHDLERQYKAAGSEASRKRLLANLDASEERSHLLHSRALKCAAAIADCDDELQEART